MKKTVLALGIGYVVYVVMNMAQVMVISHFINLGSLPFDTVAGRIVYWMVDVAIGVVAGYVAALVAGRDEIKHGAMLGAVMVTVQVFSFAAYLGSSLNWQTAVGFVLTVVAPTLGGWLRAWQKENKAAGEDFRDLGGKA